MNKSFTAIEPMIKAQYEPAMKRLDRSRGLGEGIVVPSLQQIMDVLGAKYKDVLVEEVLKMQQAVLMIEPKSPFANYVAALGNGVYGRRWHDPYVPPYI